MEKFRERGSAIGIVAIEKGAFGVPSTMISQQLLTRFDETSQMERQQISLLMHASVVAVKL